MDIELRYCRKCKRQTIQVKQRLLTQEAERGYNSELWFMENRDGRYPSRKEQDEIEKNYMIDEYYCPQCGNHWIPSEEEIRTVYKDKRSPKFVAKRLS